MKREIKFKAKRKDGQGWAFGFYYEEILYKDLTIHYITSLDLNRHEIIEDTICEFIGKKDKNGVEIYEGDLLADYYPVDDEDESRGLHCNLLPVVWCGETLSWCVDGSFNKKECYLVNLVVYFGNHLEIKGNIHD